MATASLEVHPGVKDDMKIAQEEICGPVVAVMPFESEEYTQTKSVWADLNG